MDGAKAVQELLDARHRAFIKGDLEAVVDQYSEESKIFPIGGPILATLEERREYIRSYVDSGAHFMSILADHDQLSDNIVVTSGVSAAIWDKTQERRNMKFIIIWKKYGSDWKVYRHIHNWDRN